MIFISYNWSSTKEVDFIESVLKSYGLQILRDKIELKYKDNIPLFMKRIVKAEYALFFLSDKYFRSEACWFELMEFNKKPEFERKALPIIDDKFNFTSNEYRIELIEFWQDKLNKLLQKKNELKGSFPYRLKVKIDEYKNIIEKTDEIITFFSDSNYQKYSDFEKGNGNSLLEFLGIPRFEFQNALIELQKINNKELKKILLKRYIIKTPDLPYGHFELGNLYLKERKFKECLIHYHDALTNHGKGIPEIHSNIGVATLQLIDFDNKALNEFTKQELKFIDNAIMSFNQANNLNECSGYHMNLGLTYNKIGKPNASFHFEKAIELDPDNKNIYYNIAKSIKDNHKSIEYYNLAIQIDKNFQFALFNRGRLFMKMGKYHEATNDFTQIISIEKDLKSIYQRGKCYLELKKYQNAFNDFNLLIELENSASNNSFYYRGVSLMNLHKYKDAIADFIVCLSITKNKFDTDTYLKRGYCYLKTKNLDDALIDFETILNNNPLHSESLFNKGGILFQKKQYQSAIECYQKIIDNDDNIPEARRNIIECKRKL